MRRVGRGSALKPVTACTVAIVVLGYLGLVALFPGIPDHLPSGLTWLGKPASWPTFTVGLAALAAGCVAVYQISRGRRSGGSIALVVVLSITSLLLALAAYVPCGAKGRTPFFLPLIWAGALVRGNTGDITVKEGSCPVPVPIALEMARFAGLAAVFIAVLGIAAALLQSRVDRTRVFFADSITAVVGIDEDAQSMIAAIANSQDPDSTLAVITATPDGSCERYSRTLGAHVIVAEFDEPRTLPNPRLWRRLNRLYLMSPDPWTNLQRLGWISDQLPPTGGRLRVPLIVRIDDPWQAEAWRAQQFGGSDSHWVADAVGMYEVTARRLLDRIFGPGDVKRLVVAGTSPLTLALLSDVARRQAEHDFYPDAHEAPMPALTLVAENADEYREDHQRHRVDIGLPADRPPIDALNRAPSVGVLSGLLTNGDSASAAVIFVDTKAGGGAPIDPTAATRLAGRFPSTPVFAWDPNARVTEDRVPLIGKLRTYRLAMDLPEGQAHDAWERAARLIHERYAATAGHSTEATLPWAQLDEFYRGSNRRIVRNALWMVEQIGEHTWSTHGRRTPYAAIPNLANLEPLEQLERLGFDRMAALAMARAEHEDWCHYYREAGWSYGPVRDNARKIHDKLVDWAQVQSDPDRLTAATASVADTLLALRELGYRSRPVWEKFRRSGTVLADQRHEPWTWTTSSGETMHAKAGDWAVEGSDGDLHSVTDEIFRATHELESGRRWRRCGIVEARPARHGEIVETLEGPAKSAAGDWVIRGAKGEMWSVPGADFTSGYEGPLEDSVSTGQTA